MLDQKKFLIIGGILAVVVIVVTLVVVLTRKKDAQDTSGAPSPPPDTSGAPPPPYGMPTPPPPYGMPTPPVVPSLAPKIRCYDYDSSDQEINCNVGYRSMVEDPNVWRCGEDCVGGKYYTDGGCKCACIPAAQCI